MCLIAQTQSLSQAVKVWQEKDRFDWKIAQLARIEGEKNLQVQNTKAFFDQLIFWEYIGSALQNKKKTKICL